MNASGDFLYIDLDAQAASTQQPQVVELEVELEDIDTIDPLRFAALLAANAQQTKSTDGELADAIEIDLTAEEMDALLEVSWLP